MIWELICKLADRDGVVPLNKLPGLWNRKLDSRWEIWINPHAQAISTGGGVSVDPFNCYVEFNGFPAGSFSPKEGILAAGTVANVDTFMAALRMAAQKGAAA